MTTETNAAAETEETTAPEPIGSATYDPADNKLRFRPFARLDDETYQRVKAAGFAWAPRQELFVAPMWTPGREDLLIELAGEIDDEDTTLVDRAEQRADRFENYSEKREREAHAARATADAIGARFEFGQPILVGHHSERKARRDKERIDSAMRKSVNLWRTSQYWESRAAGALRHAKYKELPAVRARRLKKLEAEMRGQQRDKDRAEQFLRLWKMLHQPRSLTIGGLEITFKERAAKVANACNSWDLAAQIERGEVTPEDAQAKKIADLGAFLECRDRWIEHLTNRIAYERAMLGEAGGLPADRFGLEVGGQVQRRGKWFAIARVNRRDGQVISVTVIGHFAATVSLEEITDYRPPAEGDAEKVAKVMDRGPLCNYPGPGFVHMTAAEWKALPRWSDASYTQDHKATETHGRHRTKRRPTSGFRYDCVFITDAKRVDPPAPPAVAASLPAPHDNGDAVRAEIARTQRVQAAQAERAERSAPFVAMADALKNGGAVAVSAPQLFPTPMALAEVMVTMADIQATDRILEPSAGTGNLLRAIGNAITITSDVEELGGLVAVEINPKLAAALKPLATEVICDDFLALAERVAAPTFDVVLMNPPFAGAADVLHIKAALRFLKPGGRLVAICADGPRQNRELKPLVEKHGGTWEKLPPDTFRESGTGVNTVLLSMVGL